MSSQQDGTETPQIVVDLATEQAKLDRTALIGVFGKQSAPGALIRLPDGAIARVTVGDNVAGGSVVAIDDDRLILTRMGSEQVLRLPAA